MQKLDKSKLSRNLGKKYKLAPFLDKALMTFDETWDFKYEPKEGDTGWHPSGHCTPPVSVLYQDVKPEWDAAKDLAEGLLYEVPEVIKSEQRKSYMTGHYWHQFLQHLCFKLEFCGLEDIERRGAQIWKGSAKDPHPYHWATGSGDIAPCVLPIPWKGVVDFKTMSAVQFKQANLPAWAAFKYKCQINIYMDFFDLEHGLILCINKDGPHDFKEFEFERDQELIEAIYAKWKFVSECLENDIEITEADDPHFTLPGQE